MLNYEINGNCRERQRDCVVSAKKKKKKDIYDISSLGLHHMSLCFYLFIILYFAPSVV